MSSTEVVSNEPEEAGNVGTSQNGTLLKEQGGGASTSCAESACCQPDNDFGTANILVTDRTSLVSLMCRICYDDTLDEPVISPCLCKGSIGVVHKSCLERWLAESNTNKCDLCQYLFQTQRTTKYSVLESFYRWLRFPPSSFALPIRDIRGDLITCAILLPFAILLIYLCLMAADYYNRKKFAFIPIAKWTALSVMVMGMVVILGFCSWIFLVLRYHIRVWYFWWQRETVVKVLLNAENETNE